MSALSGWRSHQASQRHPRVTAGASLSLGNSVQSAHLLPRLVRGVPRPRTPDGARHVRVTWRRPACVHGTAVSSATLQPGFSRTSPVTCQSSWEGVALGEGGSRSQKRPPRNQDSRARHVFRSSHRRSRLVPRAQPPASPAASSPRTHGGVPGAARPQRPDSLFFAPFCSHGGDRGVHSRPGLPRLPAMTGRCRAASELRSLLPRLRTRDGGGGAGAGIAPPV